MEEVRAGLVRSTVYDCDVLVIGGGIVGLSTAYAITRAAPGTRVTVLEKEPGPARHQTGRNSGVIHSGVYYRPGSLKARYAVRGAAEMVKFCAEYGIDHAVTGKLIVATDRAELPRLHALVQRGRENGIPVRELSGAQIQEYEPEVRGLAAIHVGTTGICDYVAVARQLARASGAEIRYGAEVHRVDRRPGLGVAVRTRTGDVLRARVLVNCGGLHCDRIARLTGDDPGMRIVPFRGEYYELARPELVRGLVCLGRVVGGHHDVARAGRVAAEALAGVQVGRFLGHEALLRRLAGDPHALADVGPGRARTSGLVHEVADEVVGHLAEVLAGDDGVLELFQRLRMHLLDRGDEFVEAYG
ncbi:L-2-hydroxyglutarate oxidase [Streptomyces anthocyanicus]|uniref:L-2-hydroxyglutarate oxidase n=1 Tax=Streptomyces anthocyanicus TaxID=68174 RepID=UPI00336A3F01